VLFIDGAITIVVFFVADLALGGHFAGAGAPLTFATELGPFLARFVVLGSGGACITLTPLSLLATSTDLPLIGLAIAVVVFAVT